MSLASISTVNGFNISYNKKPTPNTYFSYSQIIGTGSVNPSVAISSSGKYGCYYSSGTICISTNHLQSFDISFNDTTFAPYTVKSLRIASDESCVIFETLSSSSRNFYFWLTSSSSMSSVIFSAVFSSFIEWCFNGDCTRFYYNGKIQAGYYTHGGTPFYVSGTSSQTAITLSSYYNGYTMKCNYSGNVVISCGSGTWISTDGFASQNPASLTANSTNNTVLRIPDISNNGYTPVNTGIEIICDISPGGNIAIIVSKNGNYYVAYTTSSTPLNSNVWIFVPFYYLNNGTGMTLVGAGRNNSNNNCISISDGSSPNIYVIQNNVSGYASTASSSNYVFYFNHTNPDSQYMVSNSPYVWAASALNANALLTCYAYAGIYLVKNALIPNPPTNLTLDTITSTSIRLSFTPSSVIVTNDQTTNYTVTTTPTTQTYTTTSTQDTTTVYQILSGLSPNTTYTVNVYASILGTSATQTVSGTTTA